MVLLVQILVLVQIIVEVCLYTDAQCKSSLIKNRKSCVLIFGQWNDVLDHTVTNQDNGITVCCKNIEIIRILKAVALDRRREPVAVFF